MAAADSIGAKTNGKRMRFWQILFSVSLIGAAGLGLSILPSCYQDAGVANVVARPLDTPDAESRLLVGLRASNASVLAHRLVDCALQVSSRVRSRPGDEIESAEIAARG